MQPDMLGMAWHALTLLLEPMRLLILVVGVLIGLAIGVLPGLSGIVGLALLIPFTYHLDPHTAFALLLGMAAVITSSITEASTPFSANTSNAASTSVRRIRARRSAATRGR